MSLKESHFTALKYIGNKLEVRINHNNQFHLSFGRNKFFICNIIKINLAYRGQSRNKKMLELGTECFRFLDIHFTLILLDCQQYVAIFVSMLAKAFCKTGEKCHKILG